MKSVIYSIFLLSVVGLVVSTSTLTTVMRKLLDKSPKEAFKAWHLLFRKSYILESQTALNRYQVFKDNFNYIKSVNARNLGYRLGLGPWADLTNDEYRNQILAKFRDSNSVFEGKPKYNQEKNKITFLDDEDDNLVRRLQSNQGSDSLYSTPNPSSECNDSWAKAALTCLEGVLSVKSGTKVSNKFSVHQMIECNTKNKGCEGGNLGKAFQFLVENGAVMNENYERTKNNENKCQAIDNPTKINDYLVEIFYEKGQSADLLKNGPYVGVVDASSREFQHYDVGVLELSECKEINHPVVVTSINDKYVRVRNSWGSGWGNNGFATISRDSSPLSCFTEFMAYQPQL